MIQGLLAAYLSIADYYVFRSEAELGKGHADIALEPLIARYPQLRRGYLIELKYLSRGESVAPDRVAAAAGAASAQLERKRVVNPGIYGGDGGGRAVGRSAR